MELCVLLIPFDKPKQHKTWFDLHKYCTISIVPRPTLIIAGPVDINYISKLLESLQNNEVNEMAADSSVHKMTTRPPRTFVLPLGNIG